MSIVVELASVIGLFAFGLYPQAFGLEKAGFAPGWAWVVAILLVLVEVSLVTIIYSQTCTPCFMNVMFEKVLKNRGHGELLENTKGHSSCGRCCNACCKVSILLRIATLPLNLIPILGTILYVYLNGTLSSWELHLPYFAMKGLNYAQQKQIIADNQLTYSSFGMQVAFMNLIPGFAFLFLFTNSVGAALFAADLEDEAQKTRQPVSRQQVPEPKINVV